MRYLLIVFLLFLGCDDDPVSPSDECVELWGECYNIETTTELVLYHSGLTGEIPTEIGSLTNLISLHLSGNQLTGEIPSEIGSLTNLIGLYLTNNQLTGEIPSEIGSLTNLTHLYLYSNQLTGEIPSEIGNLTNLIDLSLNFNQLTGEIPSEICNLIDSNLSMVELGNNQLCPPYLSCIYQYWQSNAVDDIDSQDTSNCP